MVPAAFEDVQRADHVAVHVDVRVLDRVAHAGLGAEVNHPVEALRPEQGLHTLAIGQVEEHEAEAQLLRAIVTVPQLREEVRDLLSLTDALTDPVNARLAGAVVASGDLTGRALFEAVAKLEPDVADELSEWLVDVADRESVLDTFAETVGRIKEFALRRQILRVQANMQAMDPVKDAIAYDDMFRQVAALTKELQALRSRIE